MLITIAKDGPYRIAPEQAGDLTIVDHEGNVITPTIGKKGIAWTLKNGDQIFMKDTKFKNDHPFYKSANDRLGRSRWFKFDVEETEIDGVQGLLLTCTSVTHPNPAPKVTKPILERNIITKAQWADAMDLAGL